MVAEGVVHILMVAKAFQGHMNPMVKLAKSLISKGVRVTIATDEILGRQLMLKFRLLPAAENKNLEENQPGIRVEFFSDGLSPEFNRETDIATFVKSIKTIGAENLSNLIARIKEQEGLSCIIFSPFMPWVPEIAAAHGIPCAVLWIQCCATFLIYYHFFKHPNLFPSLEYPNETIDLPGLPLLQVRDLPSFIFPSSPRVFYELVSELVQVLDKVQWVLGSSFNELEEEIIKSIASFYPIHPIGPLVSPFMLGKEENNVDLKSGQEPYLEWLDKQPPSSVIYISFGSITALSQKQIDSVAEGVKNSSQRFLWVLRKPKKGSEAESGKLSSQFLEETKEKGIVVPWCNQEKVLLHPSVSCFVTHCGWNSTLETVAAGVPVITYPEWTDQPTDAKLLVDVFKIGVRLNVDEERYATAEEVERCIREITEGPRAEEMRKRALELKEAARNAVANGGSSDQNIDHFISKFTERN